MGWAKIVCRSSFSEAHTLVIQRESTPYKINHFLTPQYHNYKVHHNKPRARSPSVSATGGRVVSRLRTRSQIRRWLLLVGGCCQIAVVAANINTNKILPAVWHVRADAVLPQRKWQSAPQCFAGTVAYNCSSFIYGCVRVRARRRSSQPAALTRNPYECNYINCCAERKTIGGWDGECSWFVVPLPSTRPDVVDCSKLVHTATDTHTHP